jgi:L-ascorbate metabolism protein UlaG (beta-lactamase superfamily)
VKRLLIPALASLFSFVQCASQQPVFDESEWLEKVNAADPALLYAPHRNNKGFFNPWMERPQRQGNRSWFWDRIFAKKRFAPFNEKKYSFVLNDYSYLSDTSFDSISFAGHASIIIKMNAQTIFTDPFFSNSALVVAKKAKIKFDFSKVPDRPVVLISHNHYDHLDKYSVKKLIKNDPVFIVPLGLKDYIVKLGVKTVHELDWWQSIRLGEINYTLLPAQHWSRRIGQKGGASLWGGYLIEGSKTIYFSGDSGYFIGFREFGGKYNIDYALLGAGAYEPRWFMHYAHMNVPEFFRAAEELNAKTAIPMHFGVISLSDEPLLYPLYEVDRYIEENQEYQQRVRGLRVGEFIKMPPPDPLNAQ